MSSPEGPSFPSGLLSGGTSPSGNEGFFPFVLERQDSFLGGGPRPEEPKDLALQLQQKEKDLLLAAELGKMLLECNEELQRRLEMLSAQHSEREERLQQENHELRRGLAARGAEWEARTVELEGDLEALRAQLGEQRSEQQDSGRERARALSELSEQNLRLSQQLAQLELARSEAGEALSALRRLQRRVSELEEESRLQDANISGASLQLELAHSLDSDKDQDQNTDRRGDSLATLSPETQEASSHQPSPQEERLEPPRKRASLSPAEILEEKEAEVVRLQDEMALQREELQSLREELQRQKELRAQEDPEEVLSGALSDRDEAVNKSLELALELSRVSLERDSLSRELLRTIRQKVALTQELEAWQDDMQVVIGQQLRSQRQKELSAAGSAPSRAPSRLGPGPAGGFFSNLFRRT
ncbi:BICD family-like cargo adapter 2 isoform X3 [Physeter macrocephalus]|uniref:BICD family-like cargo adapter 2 n=1 Tax=Physeter macrocephalus TaxID=9755 RepID=A0A9W2X3V1_PHYMC|nr:BICD family-like cargo adapter 2 isoform X3 [Physeter catodon]